jgi:acyl carrier protein
MRANDMAARAQVGGSPRQGLEPAILRERIRQFIRDSFLVDEFGDDESFLASGLIDSLGVLQLVSFVESEYAIPVADKDLTPDNFDSVTKLAAYVQRRQRDRAA